MALLASLVLQAGRLYAMLATGRTEILIAPAWTITTACIQQEPPPLTTAEDVLWKNARYAIQGQERAPLAWEILEILPIIVSAFLDTTMFLSLEPFLLTTASYVK